MPKQPCARPGCGALVAKGYCEAHTKAVTLYDKSRGSAASRGYDAAWDVVRREVLLRDNYLCQPCKRKGRLTPACLVDHIIALADGGERLDKSNLESNCRDCHAAKTWRERRARLGN